MKPRPVFECLAWDQRTKRRDAINLIARAGTSEDIAECYALHESLALPYTKSSWRILPQLWRELLSREAMQLCLVVNRASLVASRTVSFSAVLFLSDEFCADARSKFHPHLGVQLARQYLSGKLLVLNREQVAHANAGEGLNAVMCFEGWIQDGLSAEQLLAMRAKQNEALHLALSGYRLKEFLVDPAGDGTSQWMLDAGARLRCSYFNYFRKNHLATSEFSKQPCLIGLTKEEAFTHPGSSIAGLFIYTPPRFHFNRSQRVLLRHALMGETCDELATSLSLSPWTIKKRWHDIYERVTDVDTELLPPPVTHSMYVTSRGPERRRRLLNYLRQHLEELRPYEARTRKLRHTLM